MGFPLILVFPAGSAQGFNVARTKALLDLGLVGSKTLALRPIRIGAKKTTVEDNALRDRWVMALSHTLIPISIRPGGNFETFLNSASLNRDSNDFSHKVDYQPPPPLKRAPILKNVRIPEWYLTEDYLIHWTRSCVGPWPGESHAEYFRRTVESQEEETEGLSTLKRILKEGVIRASGRLVRGGYSVVPFTQRPPQDLPELVRWRAGLRRWTFEPYGLALKKERLEAMGARPVTYGELSDFEKLPENDRPFFQAVGSHRHNWQAEQEWRILGDVELRHFDDDEVVVFVPDSADMPQMSRKCKFRITSLKI